MKDPKINNTEPNLYTFVYASHVQTAKLVHVWTNTQLWNRNAQTLEKNLKLKNKQKQKKVYMKNNPWNSEEKKAWGKTNIKNRS